MANTLRSNLIKKSRSDLIFSVFNYFILTVVLLIVLYPLYIIIIASVSESNSVVRGDIWIIPKGFTFSGFKRIFIYKKLWRGYANTLLYTTVGTLVNLVVTLPAAYALSKKNFVGRQFITILFMIVMFFNGGLIPTYLTIKSYGITDSIWALILPGAITTYNLIICRTFFSTTIPSDLWEAAQIDG